MRQPRPCGSLATLAWVENIVPDDAPVGRLSLFRRPLGPDQFESDKVPSSSSAASASQVAGADSLGNDQVRHIRSPGLAGTDIARRPITGRNEA